MTLHQELNSKLNTMLRLSNDACIYETNLIILDASSEDYNYYLNCLVQIEKELCEVKNELDEIFRKI